MTAQCQFKENAQRTEFQTAVAELEANRAGQSEFYAQQCDALAEKMSEVSQMEQNIYALACGQVFQLEQGFLAQYQAEYARYERSQEAVQQADRVCSEYNQQLTEMADQLRGRATLHDETVAQLERRNVELQQYCLLHPS